MKNANEVFTLWKYIQHSNNKKQLADTYYFEIKLNYPHFYTTIWL